MVTLTPLHLKQAGFSDDAIIHWVNNQRPMLKKAGFSDMEINKTYGLKEVKSNILNDNDMNVDASLLNNQNTEPFDDNVNKINKDNVSNSDTSQSVINSEINANQENQSEFLKLSKDEIAALLEELKGYVTYKKTKRANEVKKVLLNSVYVEDAPPFKLPYNNLWSSAYICDKSLHNA